MADGSRHFAELVQSASWYEVRDHVETLDGAALTKFVCDGVTEAWIVFRYSGHQWSINDQFGLYWFFVEDVSCPDPILEDVVRHFGLLLGEP